MRQSKGPVPLEGDISATLDSRGPSVRELLYNDCILLAWRPRERTGSRRAVFNAAGEGGEGYYWVVGTTKTRADVYQRIEHTCIYSYEVTTLAEARYDETAAALASAAVPSSAVRPVIAARQRQTPPQDIWRPDGVTKEQFAYKNLVLESRATRGENLQANKKSTNCLF
jgi:hypothetical protein